MVGIVIGLGVGAIVTVAELVVTSRRALGGVSVGVGQKASASIEAIPRFSRWRNIGFNQLIVTNPTASDQGGRECHQSVRRVRAHRWVLALLGLAGRIALAIFVAIAGGEKWFCGEHLDIDWFRM